MEFLVVWIVLAVVVAMVANSKGRGPVLWFFYGLLVWPIALTHALLIKREDARPAAALHGPSGQARVAPGFNRAAPPSAPSPADASELDRLTFQVASEWRAAGRQFSMLDAKEEARLRLADPG